MRGVAFWFLVSAVVYVLCGMAFGIYMAAMQDFTLAPMHGHLNLLGWVSMAIFAVYYHLVPRAAEMTLARVHFALATLSIWLLVPGIAMAITGQGEALAKVGSACALVAMLVFLTIVVRSRRSVPA